MPLIRYKRKDLSFHDVPFKRSRDTFKTEEKTQFEEKRKPGIKYIAFICISAHNSVSNNTDAIRNAAAAIAKQSYTHMGCIQSGFLYRHSEKAEKELRQLLQGKELKLSCKEVAKIDKESRRRDTTIATKFAKAAIDAGLSEVGFSFYQSNDTREPVSKNESAERKLDAAAIELQNKLIKYGFTLEALRLEKDCKTRGKYEIYTYPSIKIKDEAKKNEFDKLFQELKNATSHYLRQKIPAIPQGNFFNTLTNLITENDKLCLTSQWAELIDNQTFLDYKEAIEKELKTNTEFKADFEKRLNSHTAALTKNLLSKLIKQLKLPPDHPLDPAKLIESEKIVEKYEREFIIEEVAGLLACLMATQKAGAIPVMLYPFKISAAGKLIFELVNNFYNGEIEWRDITNVMQEQNPVSPLYISSSTPPNMRGIKHFIYGSAPILSPAPKVPIPKISTPKARSPKTSSTDTTTMLYIALPAIGAAPPPPTTTDLPIPAASTRAQKKDKAPFTLPPLSGSFFESTQSPPPPHPIEEKTPKPGLTSSSTHPGLNPNRRTQSNIV